MVDPLSNALRRPIGWSRTLTWRFPGPPSRVMPWQARAGPDRTGVSMSSGCRIFCIVAAVPGPPSRVTPRTKRRAPDQIGRFPHPARRRSYPISALLVPGRNGAPDRARGDRERWVRERPTGVRSSAAFWSLLPATETFSRADSGSERWVHGRAKLRRPSARLRNIMCSSSRRCRETFTGRTLDLEDARTGNGSPCSTPNIMLVTGRRNSVQPHGDETFTGRTLTPKLQASDGTGSRTTCSAGPASVQR